MESLGRYVAQVWHEVLMNSATAEDVAKYAPLAGRSPVELRILLLAGSTQDLPVSAYAEALHLPKSTLTSILQRLERQGYLHRMPRETDRRSACLTLTEQGVAFYHTYLAYQQDLGERILHGLNREEQQQLLALLQKIQSYMVRRP